MAINLTNILKKAWYGIVSRNWSKYDCPEVDECYAPKGYMECPKEGHSGKPTNERPTYETFYDEKKRKEQCFF